MLTTIIGDGRGTNNHTGVTKDGELCVIAAPYPPFVTQQVQPFRQFLTVDGLAGGSSDMGIDGSSTNADFYIASDPVNDRYITTLNIAVAYGTSGAPYQWANGAALTNGTRLFYENRFGEVDLHEGITSNQDMFRLGFNPINTAWELRGVNGVNDFGYFLTFDLTKLGLPFGIKLDAASNQRLTMTVRDNAGTDADTFNCIAYGFDRYA